MRKQLIGNAIRKARKDKGMTLQGLADYLGVTKQSIQNWEQARNEPKGYSASILRNKLKIDFAEINRLYKEVQDGR